MTDRTKERIMNAKVWFTADGDLHGLISVDVLMEYSGILDHPVWITDSGPINVENVLLYVSTGDISDQPYLNGDYDRDTWDMEDHYSRIAYLMINKMPDPIHLYVWDGVINIRDGNHRATAAAIRGDQLIWCTFDGDIDSIEEIFQVRVPDWLTADLMSG